VLDGSVDRESTTGTSASATSPAELVAWLLD
jgi:hypothetical protein